MVRHFQLATIVAALLAGAGTASAQSTFPTKPVHIYVPYAAGGGVDILTRTLGDVVSRQWGQTVVVENRPGAGGVVASQALVQSPPDGYALIMVASGHATNPFLYPKIPYDTFKDFMPVSLLASSPNILLVRKDSPFKNIGEVIAEAKAKPGTPVGRPRGDGNVDPSGGRALQEPRQGRSRSDPLKGGAPAINDLLGGQIQLSFNNGPELVGQLQAGRCGRWRSRQPGARRSCPMCRASAKPSRATTRKYGGDCLDPAACRATSWKKLSHDFVAALNTEAVKERLTKLGAEPIGSTPQAFDKKIQADYDKWGPIIQAAGIKAE